jgi:myo-inositol 2-dehydrogenase/D-chiro-inositol 1-dehydrogenase
MLVEAIRRGRALSCTAEDGRWSLAMCLAAQRSVETSRSVAIGEIE